MPIYAYRCSTCGHAKDVLQKMSDPVLSVCPECGAPTFVKQVTAAGFQLKGSGWYVTDFRNADKPAAAKPSDGDKADAPKTGAPATATDSTGKSDAAPTAAPSAAPASAPAPAAAAPKPESK